MTNDELVEKVADAIAKAWDDECSTHKCASAAIAVVLEEAAKVAETMPCEPGRDGPQIAAAIRAMIPREGE